VIDTIAGRRSTVDGGGARGRDTLTSHDSTTQCVSSATSTTRVARRRDRSRHTAKSSCPRTAFHRPCGGNTYSASIARAKAIFRSFVRSFVRSFAARATFDGGDAARDPVARSWKGFAIAIRDWSDRGERAVARDGGERDRGPRDAWNDFVISFVCARSRESAHGRKGAKRRSIDSA